MTDRFGLTTFGVDGVRARPGIKWSRQRGKLASWVADMDFPIAPAIVDRLRDRVETDVGYPDWDDIGRSHLPERFAERMNTRFGWQPDADRLHELGDVMQGVELAIHHLTEPGDGIVLHLPAYPPFLESIAQTRRRLIEVPAIAAVDGFHWDYDELDRRLAATAGHRASARLWILCHPHNPTGRAFPGPELERIAGIADRHDLVVVSDEIHAELVYPPHEHVPFATLGDDVAARTVTVTSSSKAFNLAGLRWAILHCGVDRLRRAIADLPSHYLGVPNLMAVEATDAAWTDGDEWLAAVLAVLDDNRRLLGKLLAEQLPGVGYHEPAATYLAWLDCAPLGLGDDPAATFRDRGVEVYSGLKFGAGGRGFVRVNFATSPSVLEAIVTRMSGR